MFKIDKYISSSPCDKDILIEDKIDHLALDGTTLCNLDILTNSRTNNSAGSLWSKINHTTTPHGKRLLRAWLLKPLFRKIDIDRRVDAVEELMCGVAAVAMSEARNLLSKCGDIERLLSRVHSMGTPTSSGHPNERAVLYETATHTRRKISDFNKVLCGLRAAAQLPEIFRRVKLNSDLLCNIVCTKENNGCFPSNLNNSLDWFFDNFDCNLASKGLFEPTRGIDKDYDAASDLIETIQQEFDTYKDEMCRNFLIPRLLANQQWKYINTKVDSKDKYLIELPVSVKVPNNFMIKGKRYAS